jgi:hypothetical protein
MAGTSPAMTRGELSKCSPDEQRDIRDSTFCTEIPHVASLMRAPCLHRYKQPMATSIVKATKSADIACTTMISVLVLFLIVHMALNCVGLVNHVGFVPGT